MAATGNEVITISQLKNAIEKSQPDMTGVVKYDGSNFSTSDYDIIDGVTLANLDTVDQINLIASSSGSSIIIGSETSAYISVQDTDGHEVSFRCEPSSASFSIDSKAVTSITDAISDSPTGSALVTDKAVADYVKSLGGGGVVIERLTPVDGTSDIYPESIKKYDLLVLIARVNTGAAGYESAMVTGQGLGIANTCGFIGDDTYMFSWLDIGRSVQFTANNATMSDVFGIKI